MATFLIFSTNSKKMTMQIKILILVFATLLFTGCNSKQKTTENKSLDVMQLLADADNNVDKQIIITGTVNHVCSHSGRRCFLIDSTGEYSIRVEAAGEIENFPKEVIGSTLLVTGILKEQRLSADEIKQMEADVIEKHPEDAENNGENCSAEMTNILQMRKWMEEHQKDYYATYYVEGLSYETTEQ